MSVLVVEPNQGLQQLLEVAIEHASPGMPVTVQPDPGSAASGLEKLKRRRLVRPKVVVLGPSVSGSISQREVSSLRRALGAGGSIIALSARPEIGRCDAKGIDASYEHPSEWSGLCAMMAKVIAKWIH